ncbi:MAG: SPOR domain-containing protein [Treponema sp.]|nr:SPOR domain-containing protein [Treponema sp.]
MEQKRTLWILIAAGVFLCIVFGVAYGMSRAAGAKNEETTAISLKESDDIWIAPYSDSKPSVKIPDTDKKLDGANLVADLTGGKTPSITDGLDYPEQGITTATIDATASTGSGLEIKPETSIASSTDGTITTTFDLSAGSSSSGTVVAQNKAAEKAMKNADTKRGELAKTLDESTTKTSPTKTTATETKKTGTTTKATTTTKTTTEAVAKVDTKTDVESSRIPDRYWVQAASYSSKKKADEARAVLDKNMVQCEVFTFEMDGKLYYRVRVGPYTTKTEAAYWKKQVDSLEQFADAGTYIVNSSAPIAKK